MCEHRHTLAIVLGRAGSKGLPGKNAAMLDGRPLVCHTIDDALNARAVDDVVVSTDGEAIADAARSMNIRVIKRPANLASDTATVDSAARHALEESRSPASIVVILYANVPVRPADLIDRAIAFLVETGADSVQSYCRVGKHHPWWMVKLDESGTVTPNVENQVFRRQDLPPLFIPDGGVIAVRRETLLAGSDRYPQSFLGVDRRGIESSPGDVIDIDAEIDLRLAEAVIETRAVPC